MRVLIDYKVTKKTATNQAFSVKSGRKFIDYPLITAASAAPADFNKKKRYFSEKKLEKHLLNSSLLPIFVV